MVSYVRCMVRWVLWDFQEAESSFFLNVLWCLVFRASSVVPITFNWVFFLPSSPDFQSLTVLTPRALYKYTICHARLIPFVVGCVLCPWSILASVFSFSLIACSFFRLFPIREFSLFQMAHTPWTTGAVLRSVFLLGAAARLSVREKESHCDF